MNGRRCVVALLALIAVHLAAFAAPVGAQARDGFPHDKHAKLFPTCTACHGTTTEAGARRSLPTPAQCATCHDGARRRAVTWAPPASRPLGLLAFSHGVHDAKAGAEANCQSCHVISGNWMAVGKATPPTCVGCHAHRAPSHLADESRCITCHRPLARATGLSDAQLSALPRTAAHERSDFLATHGRAAVANVASCATCHAQQSCARCHLDASRNATIAAIAPDPRVARLVAKAPPKRTRPADHAVEAFATSAHGRSALASTARCAVCHTQATCSTCHTGSLGRTAIASLSAGAERRPARVHATGWTKAHGASASSEAMSCAGCHAQRFCKDCHSAEKSGAKRFHPSNFVARHAPEAYASETDCSSCHNTQAFCRDCHQQSGFAGAQQRRGSGFHNGSAPWLLQHGRAARQELNTCTSCHQQNYCQQCHSASGWRISPHGPDFDAKRMAARNKSMCLRCHLKDPLIGR